MIPDAPHTFRWRLRRDSRAWGTVWTDRRAKQRKVRLHMRKSINLHYPDHRPYKSYSLAHDLTRREAWRLGWALVIRAVTR